MDYDEIEENGTADYYLDLKEYIREFIDRNYPLTSEDFNALVRGEKTENIIKRQETQRILTEAMEENLADIAGQNSQILENAEQGNYTAYSVQDYDRDLNEIKQKMLEKLWNEQHHDEQTQYEQEEQTSPEQNDHTEEQQSDVVEEEQHTNEEDSQASQPEQTGEQLIDDVVEQGEEIEIRSEEISDANREINQTERDYIQEQQQQMQQEDIGMDIGE